MARAALIALYSYDTTIDTGPNDTAHRATTWLTPQFATAIRSYRPIAAPGAQWDLWTSHRAYITPTIASAGDDHPPDTATTAYRQYRLTLTVLGRDHWKGPPQTITVFVTLTRPSGGWLVDTVTPR